MRKFFNITALLVVVFAIICCSHKGNKALPDDAFADSLAVVDTITIYGLACEGCTDSVVWLLPHDASDPVPYDIVAAMRKHKVFGKLKTGDYIGVVVNPEDSTVADIVINLDQIKGTWCYKVMPTLKRGANLPERIQQAIIDSMPDSIKNVYYLPQEYGITIKRNNLASPMGSIMPEEEDEENPFTYPGEDKYVAWHLLAGRLVLTKQQAPHVIVERDSLGNEIDEAAPVHIAARMVKDTVDIDLMLEDTLVLKFKDHTQGYYRKK